MCRVSVVITFVLLFLGSVADVQGETHQRYKHYICDSGKYKAMLPPLFVQATSEEKMGHVLFLPCFTEGKFSASPDVQVWKLTHPQFQGFLANIVVISQDCDRTLAASWYHREYIREYLKGEFSPQITHSIEKVIGNMVTV